MNAIKDKAFKHLFTHVEIITDFLESLYSYFGIEKDLNIKYLNGEQLIPGEYINMKDFYGDIVAETEDTRKYAKGDVIMEKTVRYLEKFYAEEGNSREDRFKSDLEDMKRIGYEEGRTDGINTTALAMLESNFSIEDIAKVTKMSVNKIKALIN